MSANTYVTEKGCMCFAQKNGYEYICIGGLHPWMKEEKGIRHGGEGAYLCCPVFTTVHFSLRKEGSSEYICVCVGRESLRPNF